MSAFLRRYSVPVLIVVVIAATIATGASAAGQASPGPSQPLLLAWSTQSPPPSFYEPGEKLSYRFSVTNTSAKTVYIHVNIANIFDAADGGQILLRDLAYKLKPGATIKVLHQVQASNTVATTTEAPGFPLALDTVVTAQAEGYPPIGLLAEAWSQTK